MLRKIIVHSIEGMQGVEIGLEYYTSSNEFQLFAQLEEGLISLKLDNNDNNSIIPQVKEFVKKIIKTKTMFSEIEHTIAEAFLTENIENM